MRRYKPVDRNGSGRITPEGIIAISSRLFQEQGFHATSLEQVARELGVTRPALYHYFRSKQDILYGIHRTAQHRLGLAIDEVQAQHLTPREAIAAILRNHALTIIENAHLVGVMFQEEAGLPARRRNQLREARREYARSFAEVYEQGVKQGQFIEMDPLLAAFLMFGACNWISNWYRPGRWTPAMVADSISTLLMQGVLRDPCLLGSDGGRND
jgi:AcrR family transcriptional regulator